MDIDDKIAASIERFFKDRKLSPTGEAEKIDNLGRTSIRDIITRKSKSPTYATLLKIASHYGLSVPELITYPNNIDPNSTEFEILGLWSQLTPVERRFLLNTGKVQISSRDPSQE